MSTSADPVDNAYVLVDLILRDLRSVESSFARSGYRELLASQLAELSRLGREVDAVVAQHISEYDIAVEYASMHRYMMRTRRNYLSILSASHHLIDEATTMRAKKYSSKAQKRLGKKRRFLWSDIVPFSPDSSISREINRLRDPRLVPNNWRGVSRYIRDTKSILGPISVELLNMRVRPKDLGYRYVFSVASGCATRRD